MLCESIKHGAKAVTPRFENYKVMRVEFNGFFITKQIRRLDRVLFCCKAFRKRLQQPRSREKHSTTSCVPPRLLSCSSHFLRASFRKEQSTVKASLFVIYYSAQRIIITQILFTDLPCKTC